MAVQQVLPDGPQFETVTVSAGAYTLKNIPNPDSIVVAGFTKVFSTPSKGQFQVTPGSATLTFNTSDNGATPAAQYFCAGPTGITTSQIIALITQSNNSSSGSGAVSIAALGNFAAGGSIGTAPNTVDVFGGATINQTTAGQTLTLPNPTSATAGKLFVVINIGSASFTMFGEVVASGDTISAEWGGSSWNYIGVSTLAKLAGQINLATQTSGLLSVSNGGTGQGSSTGTGAVVLANAPTFTGTPVLNPNVLLRESAADALTALGTNQSNALALTNEVNRLTTVAVGTGVLLPPSAPGLTVYVINHGANGLQVYGSGTDTIDDVATATGVTQMVNSLVLYSCTSAGLWYSSGLGSGYSGSLATLSFADALTANAGGVQAGATPITTSYARFTTVGGSGFSSVLPAAAAGLSIVVINAGANNLNIFPAGSDSINALAASAAFSAITGSVTTFYSTVAGKWHTISSVVSLTSQVTGILPVANGGTGSSAGAVNSFSDSFTFTAGAGTNTITNAASGGRIPKAITNVYAIDTTASVADANEIFIILNADVAVWGTSTQAAYIDGSNNLVLKSNILTNTHAYKVVFTYLY